MSSLECFFITSSSSTFLLCHPLSFIVILGLDPRIHSFIIFWILGINPRMTFERCPVWILGTHPRMTFKVCSIKHIRKLHLKSFRTKPIDFYSIPNLYFIYETNVCIYSSISKKRKPLFRCHK